MDVKGSIVDQVDRAYEQVKDLIKKKISFDDSSPQRTEIYEYDLYAVREAIINAIVHRDYSINNNQHVEVSIFDDRIEIKSTGGLLNNRSVEDLIDGVTIGRRNPIVCSVMKDLKYIESRGRGLDKIIKPKHAWKKEPVFTVKPDYFQVTLFSNFYKEVKIDYNLSKNEKEILNYIRKKWLDYKSRSTKFARIIKF